MTTKIKRKKHTLNPIMILGFITIILLLVILSITIKTNVSEQLKAFAPQCLDLTKEIGKSIWGEGTGAGVRLAKRAAYKDAVDQFNTWWTTSTSLGGTDGTGKEQTEKALAKELDCAKGQPQCQQEKNATVTCLPTQDVRCSYSTSTNTTPISATVSCIFGIRCSNACETVKLATTPLTFPQCTKSGPPKDCYPNSEGFFQVDSTATGTATKDELWNGQAQVVEAKSRAITNAQKGLDTKCKALAATPTKSDPMLKCNPNKYCEIGCKPEGNAVWSPPYLPLTASGIPGNDTADDCKTATVASPPGSVTIKATCYAACKYQQKCVPLETPDMPVSDPFTDPLPGTTTPSRR